MAFNKAKEERKWKIRKEAEEKLMRKLGTDEATIMKLREHDWKAFNSEQRFYRRLVKADTYIENLKFEEKENTFTVDELLNSIENEQLYKELCKMDKLTMEIILFKMHGFTAKEISQFLNLSEKAIYRRVDRFKEKMKKI